MTAYIGAGVTLNGIEWQDDFYTVNLASSITKADVGKALSVDSTAANTMKLAADGDIIRGRLAVFEDRSAEGIKLGTVQPTGGMKLTVKSGQTVTVGQSVVGAGGGEIKAAAAPTAGNYVAEVGTGYAIVFFGR